MTTDSEGQDRGAIPSDTFSMRLVIVRHFAGRLSIEQAASQAGINPEAWRRWEDGARPRDLIEVTSAISEAYGIDLNWLMFGGPLTPARGKPTKRPDSVTFRKGNLTVRPADTRPNSRDDSSRSKSLSTAGRRAAPVR
jgi:hypothetical protein